MDPAYITSKLAIALISPLGSAMALWALAGVLRILRKPRTATALGIAAFAWLAIWSTPWASNHLMRQMESAFPPVAVEKLPTAQAIVLLGGGVEPLLRGAAHPNLLSAVDRVWHTARLYHAGKAPLLVPSGGGGDTPGFAGTEASAMQQLLRDLRVPDAAVLLEDRSLNTAQNAQMTLELLQQRGVRRILLVTSALHMRRALAQFRAQGFDVVPAATDHVGRDTSAWPWWRRWLPSAEALDDSGRAMKEWVGARVL